MKLMKVLLLVVAMLCTLRKQVSSKDAQEFEKKASLYFFPNNNNNMYSTHFSRD